ncbi:MAG: hypothetical protein L3J71_05125 [Victivallaceae bacterium]|nr:hypothetical protein [Victivallaceae bacterium]
MDFPENTLVSFSDAIATGVDWIELDVRLSAGALIECLLHSRKN